MTNNAIFTKKHSTMAEALRDLIKISRKPDTRRSKKDNASDDSEVMTSEDDDNPEGDMSGDDKKYDIFIDPRLLEEMRKQNAQTLRVVRNGQGDGGIEILFQ